ncbi:MAG: TVP38/TMEM64 family protein [Methanosarcina sp.]|nr:MAG: TVP38/TMEM64 family protein [Methanosarcina sp.]
MNSKKLAFYLWLLLITGGITSYILFPEKINLMFLKEISDQYHFIALIIYFLLLSARGLTMIPSTPLLLAGVLIFDPLELFAVNMAGILSSSAIVYYFSKYLCFDTYFETKYGKYTQKIRDGLKDKELPVIVGWSFFPLVPTDLIVYVGSSLRIPVLKCLLGVFIGESVINAFYIFSTTLILKI